MRIKMQLLFLIIPVIGSAQNLIKCNDSTFYFINQKENYYCYVELIGDIQETENNKVISFNNYAMQSLLLNKIDYKTNDNDDIAILTNYMLSETEYYSGLYKEKLYLMMIPIEISKNKKAVIWYFDVPKKIQDLTQEPSQPAVKQVFVSVISRDFIYSIGTTQFKDQSFDNLQIALTRLIKSINSGKGKVDSNKLCGNLNNK
ncbi:MAG: hypothetical protein K9J13_12025 [Saprospiraceae bacterium]|nr:hypothetical protein [Saprospiraceae bacterium]